MIKYIRGVILDVAFNCVSTIAKTLDIRILVAKRLFYTFHFSVSLSLEEKAH
jgi:hypothetical protein